MSFEKKKKKKECYDILREERPFPTTAKKGDMLSQAIVGLNIAVTQNGQNKTT